MELYLLLLVLGVGDEGSAVDHGVHLEKSERLVGHDVGRLSSGSDTLAVGLVVLLQVVGLESFKSLLLDRIFGRLVAAVSLSGDDPPESSIIFECQAAV